MTDERRYTVTGMTYELSVREEVEEVPGVEYDAAARGAIAVAGYGGAR